MALDLTKVRCGFILTPMFAKVNADYSKFPIEIRDAMPIVEGEVSELRTYWETYHFLFMENEEKTNFLAERFGPMLGLMQNLLERQMMLSISCLTDADSKWQRNVSLSQLKMAVTTAQGEDFSGKINAAFTKITHVAKSVRLHRNKHLAHFDLSVALGSNQLPTVFLSEIQSTLELMESYLNLFHWEFEKAEVGFESLPCDEFTAQAFMTACKSKVFDELEAENVFPVGELECRMDKWPWCK